MRRMWKIPVLAVVGVSFAYAVAWVVTERRREAAQAELLAAIAEVQTACEAIALWEHRAETGALPATLNELAPRMGGAIPIDPFTQKPLIYQRLGEYFELRSTGPNGIDDLGTASRIEDDIVWHGN